MTTRGIRNNNPANIRKSANKWLGLKSLQTDCSFCQFTNKMYGIRAFFILMRTYRYKYNLKTPEQIINRFAPSVENNVKNYLCFIESKGLPRNLNLDTDPLYCILAKYVFYYESQFRCNIDYLKQIMDDLNCHVINEKKECKEVDLF